MQSQSSESTVCVACAFGSDMHGMLNDVWKRKQSSGIMWNFGTGVALFVRIPASEVRCAFEFST